jgi:Starch-binding associating with outer membrane
MKKIKIFIYTGLLVFVTAGCSKLADINVDPNNPSLDQATAQVLIPSGQLGAAGQIGGEYAPIGGLWAQYYTQSAFSSQYRTLDAYSMINTDNNTAYQEMYRNALSDLQLAKENAQKNSKWAYYLIATVTKAYSFQVMADLYDKVPYSEALQGKANIQPKFDDGYSIYKALLAEIDEALSKNFNVLLPVEEAAADLVFNGDMDRWEEFANTLKLKMYLRMINAKPAEAEAGIKALYTANAPFLTVGAGITSFTNASNSRNPFYEQNINSLNTPTNLRLSVTFKSWLQANNDPRIVSYFGSSNPGAVHQGDFNSTDPAYGNAAVFVQKATDPVWFISKAESYLMQAEARERYYAGAGAKVLYDSGVTAAFQQVGLTPGSLLTGNYIYPAGTMEQKIEAIIVQKWASFPGTHDLEGFFEINRTGYPKTSAVYSTSGSYIPGQLVYVKNGVTGGKFPKRLLFPNIERSRNANTPPEVPITEKTWWAK